jgi:hypothetical protein
LQSRKRVIGYEKGTIEYLITQKCYLFKIFIQ